MPLPVIVVVTQEIEGPEEHPILDPLGRRADVVFGHGESVKLIRGAYAGDLYWVRRGDRVLMVMHPEAVRGRAVRNDVSTPIHRGREDEPMQCRCPGYV